MDAFRIAGRPRVLIGAAYVQGIPFDELRIEASLSGVKGAEV